MVSRLPFSLVNFGRPPCEIWWGVPTPGSQEETGFEGIRSGNFNEYLHMTRDSQTTQVKTSKIYKGVLALPCQPDIVPIKCDGDVVSLLRKALAYMENCSATRVAAEWGSLAA